MKSWASVYVHWIPESGSCGLSNFLVILFLSSTNLISGQPNRDEPSCETLSKKVYFEIWKSQYVISIKYLAIFDDFALYFLNVFLLAKRLPLNLDISTPNI